MKEKINKAIDKMLNEQETTWLQDAEQDARDMIAEFSEQIVDQVMDDGEASTDLYNNYAGGDSYHHETHVDKDYDLADAAGLLRDLNDYRETDYGLWQGQEPEQAIATQAAYTYGNAVAAMWQGLIEEINSEVLDIEPQWGSWEDEDEAEYDMFKAEVQSIVGRIASG